MVCCVLEVRCSWAWVVSGLQAEAITMMHGPINIILKQMFAQHFRSLDVVFLYRFLPRKFKNRYSFVFRKVFPLMHERVLVLRRDLSASLIQFRSSANTVGDSGSFLVFFYIHVYKTRKWPWFVIFRNSTPNILTRRDTNWRNQCFYLWGQALFWAITQRTSGDS